MPVSGSELGASGATTVLRAGSTLVGTVSGAADLVVEGQLEGDLTIDGAVTIAPGGRVQANIHARYVIVGGNLVGDIVGADRVEVLASGTVLGDITAAHLVISDGATLKGSVQISRPGASSPTRSARPL